MIVLRKLGECGQRIENLSLTASEGEDYELLAALYHGYAHEGAIEIALSGGQRLKSLFTEKRRSTRLSMRLPVLLLWYEGEQEQLERTYTSNLSRFGCAVQSRTFFRPKTPILIQYKEKTMHARTAYSLSDYSTSLVEVGIDFGCDSGDFWEVPSPK